MGDEYLSTFPFLSKNRERLNSLKAELPEYIRRVQDLRGHDSDAWAEALTAHSGDTMAEQSPLLPEKSQSQPLKTL